MHYLIQENLYNKDGYDGLIRALKINDCKYSIHKIIPFADSLSEAFVEVPQLQDKYVCVFGAYTLISLAKKLNWKPGAFINKKFHHCHLAYNWKDEMLNYDAKPTTIGKLVEIIHPMFIRPAFDTKSFTGQIFTPDEFLDWKFKLSEIKNDYSTVSLNTEIIIAEPKQVFAEYRFFIVGKTISTYSLYKQGDAVLYNNFVDAEVINYVNKVRRIWQPHDCYVLDIALTDNGYKIIEVNCLNGAGFYAADISKLIQDLDYYLSSRY